MTTEVRITSHPVPPLKCKVRIKTKTNIESEREEEIPAGEMRIYHVWDTQSIEVVEEKDEG